MSISSGVGMISGIDYESIISQLSEASRGPIRLYQQKQATLSNKVEAYDAVAGQLRALRSQLENMSSAEDFLFRGASSSNEDALAVSAESTAEIGNYSVDVVQLARTSRWISDGVGSAEAIVGLTGETLSFTVGEDGETFSYALDADTSLTQLRDMINRDTESGVRASIVNDGSDSPMRLVLSARNSGESSRIEVTSQLSGITLTSNDVDPDTGDPIGLNAIIRVDGIEVQRSTNQFDDVIEGLSFTAQNLTTTSVQVSVTEQRGRINAQLTQFKDAFNSLVSMLDDVSDYNPDTGAKQPLFADSAVRSIRNTLARMITSPVPGASGAYTTLASIGLSLQVDGTLGFDPMKMEEALDADPDSVARLFSRIGSTSNEDVAFVAGTENTTETTYQINVTAAATRASITGNQALTSALAQDEALTFTVDDETFSVSLLAGDDMATVVEKLNAAFAERDIDMQASDEAGVLRLQTTAYGSAATFSVASDRSGATGDQLGIGTTQQNAAGTDVQGTINGRTASGEGQILSGLDGTSAEGLEVRVTATGATTATIQYSRGVAGQILDALESFLDSEDGILTTRREGLNSTIDEYNDRIDSLEARIESEAARLRKQFISMEQQLLKYQGWGDYVTRSLNSLGSSE